MQRSWILAGVLGLGVGGLLGRLSASVAASADTDAASGGGSAASAARGVRVVRAAGGSGDGADCLGPVEQEELVALRELAALQEAQLEALENELYGQPEPWPGEVPDIYTPDTFTRNVRRFFEECDIPVDILDFRCEEPPCYAMLRRDELNYSADHPWAVALQQCAPWQETYGEGLSLSTGTVTCPDGSQEGFTMLAPASDWLLDWEHEPERAEQQMRRFDVRMRQAKDDWTCAAPPP